MNSFFTKSFICFHYLKSFSLASYLFRKLSNKRWRSRCSLSLSTWLLRSKLLLILLLLFLTLILRSYIKIMWNSLLSSSISAQRWRHCRLTHGHRYCSSRIETTTRQWKAWLCLLIILIKLICELIIRINLLLVKHLVILLTHISHFFSSLLIIVTIRVTTWT